MKIKYDKPKGQRINKGSCKVKERKKRLPMFCGLTIISEVDNCFWCDELNKWVNTTERNGLPSGSHNNNISNLKQAIRHIKKHKELKKGTVLELCSNFVGYDITIIV